MTKLLAVVCLGVVSFLVGSWIRRVQTEREQARDRRLAQDRRRPADTSDLDDPFA
jgi:hypothetical protein